MAEEPTLKDRVEELIRENPVLLFMKGTPTFPQCGFSATVIAILDHLGVPYESANILEDADLLKRGAFDTLPMGYLLCGPVGTGKTFIAQCTAGIDNGFCA